MLAKRPCLRDELESLAARFRAQFRETNLHDPTEMCVKIQEESQPQPTDQKSVGIIRGQTAFLNAQESALTYLQQQITASVDLIKALGDSDISQLH